MTTIDEDDVIEIPIEIKSNGSVIVEFNLTDKQVRWCLETYLNDIKEVIPTNHPRYHEFIEISKKWTDALVKHYAVKGLNDIPEELDNLSEEFADLLNEIHEDVFGDNNDNC